MDIRGKKLVVIGGAGLIGSHTVDLLTKAAIKEMVIPSLLPVLSPIVLFVAIATPTTTTAPTTTAPPTTTTTAPPTTTTTSTTTTTTPTTTTTSSTTTSTTTTTTTP